MELKRLLRRCVCSLATIVFIFGGCTQKGEPGTKNNPYSIFFMPSQDADKIMSASKEVTDFLLKETGLHFKSTVPTSYIAVVESFGTARADVAIMNTFGYLLANEKFGAEARLKVLRNGRDYYLGQIITRADSGIKKIEDLKGKKFAFTDPSSTSGYFFPLKLIQDKGVTLGSTVFGNKHDIVVTMVYQRQVDAGATFYSPPTDDGKIQDARKLVATQFPDVEKTVSVLALTEKIPNDPVTFRKDLPEDMKAKTVAALSKFTETAEGKKTLEGLYTITGFNTTTDKEYDPIRETMKKLNVDLASKVK